MKYQTENDKTIGVEINTDIFKLLYPKDNDELTKMSKSDKVYALMILKKYYLEYRKKLNISEDITFGLEIEFDEAYRYIIEEKIYNMFPDDNWIVKDDGSLLDGGETISPILTNTEKSWIDLSNVCNIISNYAIESDKTGGHIHIGMQILGNNAQYWRNFALLWSAYENIIFRYLNGEYLSSRSKIEEQARPISKELIENINRINDSGKLHTAYYIMKLLDSGDDYQLRRKRSVNFTNVSDIEPYKYDRIENKNTIEFRSPNGTLNPIIWQNNVNLLVHLFMYAKSDRFNEDIINRRINIIKANGIPSNLRNYSYIYHEQAIELADLIFNNNLDKIYFLRQYFKTEEVSNKPFKRCRESFTK